jgi:hypothetical protein
MAATTSKLTANNYLAEISSSGEVIERLKAKLIQ